MGRLFEHNQKALTYFGKQNQMGKFPENSSRMLLGHVGENQSKLQKIKDLDFLTRG